jgi:hypothetical protein
MNGTSGMGGISGMRAGRGARRAGLGLLEAVWEA